MKGLLFILSILLLHMPAKSQDPEFSQYYAAPLYLNPAFTGTTSDHRFIANYRNQWPNIARGFETYAVSYDKDLEVYHSGIGFMALVDKAGSAGMKSTELNFLYSYKFNISDKWIISSGLNFGYASRGIEFNKLLFGDQLQFDADGASPSDDPAAYRVGNIHYFDFKAGMLAYNKTFWLGAAINHLNQPNRSLTNQVETVPVKTTFHGGMRIPLYVGPFDRDNVSVFSPSFVYKHQGKFDQLDLGAYFIYSPVMIGLWYRGIPITQKIKDNINQDAVVVILGFEFDQIELGYSYDLTVSSLGPISGGTHEIALQYHMPIQMNLHKKQKGKLIPCPTFNRK